MVKAQQPRCHKQNVELFPGFILKMQISMAEKEEMGAELLLRLWRGRWTGNCVVPSQHTAQGKLPLRSFLPADERRSRLDLSYKPFPCSQCASLRCLPACFIHVLWGSAPFQVCQQTGFASSSLFPALMHSKACGLLYALTFVLISPN